MRFKEELEKERSSRMQILHHLQRLKKSELAELKEVGPGGSEDEFQSTIYGI